MGNLVINQVSYSGEKYFYDSPILNKGINIIVGDNESGKSTFTYFIEYALGGKIKPFNNDDGTEHYKQVFEDTNNFIQVSFSINEQTYLVKRFIGKDEVFLQKGDGIQLFALKRDKDTAPTIFSDWLLEKLGIPVFEINIGAIHWYFNFSDLFRLLNYDQNTEAKKIFKAPLAENFVAESVVIRKSIFEILLGMSSAEYFKKLDESRATLKLRDAAKALLENFRSNYDFRPKDDDDYQEERDKLVEQLESLLQQREQYQRQNSTVEDKIGELAEIQAKLVDTELSASEERQTLSNITNERNKVERLHENLLLEISQIEKIIFTHAKLDLFSMEVCPFCMTEKKDIPEGHCICGSKFSDDDYEKFVYNSSEYKDILSHKQKSIRAISQARDNYNDEIKALENTLASRSVTINEFRERLANVVRTAEFAGNSTVVDDLSNQIIKTKEDISAINEKYRLSILEKKLVDDLKEKNRVFGIAQAEFNVAKKLFEENNIDTIKTFNEIFNKLLAASSYQSVHAEIDEDYMPLIDDGVYKAKSSEVPKRLMYYFTILSLSLKLPSVKHPRFLLIDTPEDSGIDIDHLKQNLELLDMALDLARNQKGELRDFQVILTTGYGKLPDSYDKYIKERFMKKENKFILKPVVK